MQTHQKTKRQIDQKTSRQRTVIQTDRKINAQINCQDKHFPGILWVWLDSSVLPVSLSSTKTEGTGHNRKADRKTDGEFFENFPQFFRGKFAKDVEQKCCQGCQTISIYFMILELIASK